jgi:Tfp pilus assembly protein PilF
MQKSQRRLVVLRSWIDGRNVVAFVRESMARCQLGKALEWTELWSQARPETEACVRLDPGSPDSHYQLARIYRRLGLTALADQQTSLQQAAALRQSEESVRRTETVTKFLVLLEH